MADKNYAEMIYVASGFVMLLAFTVAFIYYILYKEILIILVAVGFVSFLAGFIAKNRWDKSKKT